jgi:hypothetical protein
MALFGKRPSPYYGNNSANKQRETTVCQSGKCEELGKFLQVQLQKPLSVMMKLAVMRTGTEKVNPELPLLKRISSLELPASEMAAQINASEFK